jgi:hypothetical protein
MREWRPTPTWRELGHWMQGARAQPWPRPAQPCLMRRRRRCGYCLHCWRPRDQQWQRRRSEWHPLLAQRARMRQHACWCWWQLQGRLPLLLQRQQRERAQSVGNLVPGFAQERQRTVRGLMRSTSKPQDKDTRASCRGGGGGWRQRERERVCKWRSEALPRQRSTGQQHGTNPMMTCWEHCCP